MSLFLWLYRSFLRTAFVYYAFFVMSFQSKPPRLPFGLRAGRLFAAGEVRSGLACGCVCPACGSPLVAKKGSRNIPHFAHHRAMDCPQATETALHLFAKHVIREAGRVYVPDVVLPHTGAILRYRRMWPAQTVEEEVTRGPIRADLLLRNGTQELAVEIRVHHATPNYKIKHFVRQRLPALEIDVQRIFRDLLAQWGPRWQVRGLRNAILHGAAYRQWLAHPLRHNAEYALRKQARPLRIKHYRNGDRHRYYVFGCPLQADTSRPTDIWQTCAHCKYNLEIEYGGDWQGYRYVVKSPRQVLCLGHREGGVADPPERSGT